MKKALFLFFVLIATSAFSQADVLLSWNPNSESDLAGYITFIGEHSRVYVLPGDSLKTIQVTSRPYKNLLYGKTYYFAVKAYDRSGNLSGYSNEVSITIPTPDVVAPNIPGGVKIEIIMKISTQ